MTRGQNRCTRQPYASDTQARLHLRTAARNRRKGATAKPREPRFCNQCKAWHLDIIETPTQ